MKSAGFIHLHNHSEYSMLDGMLRVTDGHGKPSAFLKELSSKRVPAMAITDHGNMYGALEFYNTASAAGIKPIIGCEVYVAKGSRLDKDKATSNRRDNGHLTLLAENNEGYQNLLELVSRAFLEGFYHDPRIDLELLEKYKGGLVAMSGCLKSHVARACAAGDMAEAEKRAAEYAAIMGKDNFYLELMDHGIPEERAAMKGLLELSKKMGLPVVATNDCHYPKREDWEAHDAQLCIATGRLIQDEDRMRMSTHEFYYKSPEEMIELFSHTPEAVKSTLDIASRCNVKLNTGDFVFPIFNPPANYKSGTEGQFDYLRDLCLEGLKVKVGKVPDNYLERLEFELGVIKRMGFSGYFLIVMDFIKHARSVGIPVGPGRGSGAGSLVAYALDITRVDPLVHGLLFERFLNPDRKSMPDLDIDFSDKGRDEVIEYVRTRYGRDNVANIITYNSIKAKSALKDMGRVMDVPLADVNALCKLIPNNEPLAKVVSEVQELRDAQKDPKIKKLFDMAFKVEGLKRQPGVHAAGVVITREAVTKYVPLSNKNNKNVVTTQYDGNQLGNLGLLKMDFLGLRTLTVIESAAAMIRAAGDKDFDIYGIPLDDKKAFELLSAGRTTGVFQLESDGMKKLVKSLKPSVFSDISALVALYRPGPIQSGMLEMFVDRKHGRKKVVYDHQLMEDALRDTYGTMVYQEQVMEISKRLAGFTPGEADGLRKAMGKKNAEAMEKMRLMFVDGCKKNDIPAKLSAKIYDDMAKFAGYGFNKSHSVAYALVAYQTAWLKANYPAEFMASLLTSEIGHSPVDEEGGKENKIVTYVEEAQEMGLEVLGPDINASGPVFSLEKKEGKTALRFAMTAIKNVGDGVVAEIAAEREKNGPFKTVSDLVCRMDGRQLNKRVLESAARAGAFDSLFKDPKMEERRARALAAAEKAAASLSKPKKACDESQDMLFGADSLVQKDTSADGPAPVLSEHDLLKNEKEVLGFYLSGHPLTSLRRQMAMLTTASVEKVSAGGYRKGSAVRLGGMILQVKNITTKKGDPMARFELEDLSGSISATMFPRQYALYSRYLVPNQIVLVQGQVNESNFGEGGFEILADEVSTMGEAFGKWGKNLVVFLSDANLLDDKQLSALKSAMGKHQGGVPVYLRLDTRGSGKYVVEMSERVALDEKLFKDIESVLGEKTWQVESAS
ncbi:MAG: DNA polymerase III subunit alpha [Elusimicrobiales bacterium]|nr:DNA polymerase III subunit alpha [Elusimicrobiales bacterium]